MRGLHESQLSWTSILLRFVHAYTTCSLIATSNSALGNDIIVLWSVVSVHCMLEQRYAIKVIYLSSNVLNLHGVLAELIEEHVAEIKQRGFFG